MNIWKFAILMGIVGFIGHFLPINFGWVILITMVASAINGADLNSGSTDEEFDNHDWE